MNDPVAEVPGGDRAGSEGRREPLPNAALEPGGSRRVGPARVAAVLVLLGGSIVWFPCETSPQSAIVLALACTGLAAWAWSWTQPAPRTRGLALAVILLLAGALSSLTGWDAAQGLRQLALAAAVAALVWIASRHQPPASALLGLCLVVALLALWAVWQVQLGFDQALARAAEVPEPVRDAFVTRLRTGRAFASLTVPGHLAVLLATVLSLLVVRIRRSSSGIAAGLGSALCVLGLVLTRSPIGAALALVAVMAVLLARRRRGRTMPVMARVAAALVMAVVLAAVLLARTDLSRLEPIRLRLENWHTALWVVSGSPAAGAGLGGFGQASLAVPFPVGNRPMHAHSLPLELLADLGPVGLGLAVAAALWLAGLARRLWPRAPALAAAILVVPAHNLVDFSCYSSAVAVPWAILTGWAVAAARSEEVRPGRGAHPLVAVALGLLVVVPVSFDAASRLLERRAAEQPQVLSGPPGQLALARRHDRAMMAGRLAPWRVRPVELAAATALEIGPAACLETTSAVRRARWLRPGSASLQALEGRIALCRGAVPDAAAALWSAVQSSAGAARYQDQWDRLDEALAGNGAGQ